MAHGPIPDAATLIPQITGEVDCPWSFKPSSLLGDTVRTTQGTVKRRFKIQRAWTARKYPWGRKKVKFVAEATA
jgi:hypothetical protein